MSIFRRSTIPERYVCFMSSARIAVAQATQPVHKLGEEAAVAHIDPFKYWTEADRCHAISQSSADAQQWIEFSRAWEKLAEISGALEVRKRVEEAHTNDDSLKLNGHGTCVNPSRSLLQAGAFCPWRAPGFLCDPIACNK